MIAEIQITQEQIPWMASTIIIAALMLVFITLTLFRSRRLQRSFQHRSIKLKKENERTRVMLDSIPVACFLGNIERRVYDCNNETVRLFELKNKQEFIDHFEKDLSPEYQSDGRKSIDAIYHYSAEAIEKGRCVFNWTHQLLDGTPFPVIVTLESAVYDGEIVLMVCLRDMREYEKMSNEISRQNILLTTVNSVSSALLEPDIGHFEDNLQKAMRILAEVADVDRICVWRNADTELSQRFSLIYQWETSGIKSLVKDGSLSPDLFFDDLPFWNETLAQGNCLNSLVRDMPPAEQEVLAPRDILSILLVPVILHDNFWGFISFDYCRTERLFMDDEVLIMRSASRMMANAVIRSEMAGELVFAKELAEQSNRSKSIFLSHMSHEIRTPMNAILGIAEIQLRDETNNKDTLEAFNKIYESGNLLLNIINDILDFSKIESGKLEIIPVSYDIPNLINDTVQLHRLRYDSKPIDFSLHVDEDVPVNLFGDELRIKQVLNNILSNAFKYTDSGSIEFCVSAEQENSSSGENVILVFRVSDTGQGMNEDQLRRLFDEYSRFNLDKNRTTVGTGLGMSITKRLVGLMNGTIDAKSVPDMGSVFTVRLPQKQTGADLCGKDISGKLQTFRYQDAIVKKTRFSHEYMPYGRVLIVDDVDTNIYVTKGMLIPYGLNIETASSGFAAISKIKNGGDFDIIFMDHMMPKMDGIETVKILRNMGYKSAIIALTANAIVGRAEMFLKNGFDAFISKPIDSRELNHFLNDFILNKKPPEVIEEARREQREKKSINKELQEQEKISLNEMTELFIIDAQNAVNVLEDFFNKLNLTDLPDLKLYITTVHGMKSALANIGNKELSDSALKLEQAGKERNHAVITEATPLFISALRSIIEKNKPRQNDDHGPADAPLITDADRIYLREKLRIIQSASMTFDKNTAKNALNELKQKKWPPETRELLDEITMSILHSAYKKITALTEDFLKKDDTA